MEYALNREEDYGFFSINRIEDIAVLYLKKDFLQRATDLRTRDTLFDCLEMISEDTSVKVVVIVNSPDKQGREEYIQFFKNIVRPGVDIHDVDRLFNCVNQFILRIMELNKFVVSVDSGQIIPLFMNLGLACDYRIIADNAVFHNSYLELGLVPKGGGAFFLAGLLGPSRAAKLMIMRESIFPQEALELGLADKIVPLKRLEEDSLKVARYFAGKPPDTLLGVKGLLAYCQRGLADYLRYENETLLRIINSPDFRRRVAEIEV